MSVFVVDASLVVKWFVSEVHSVAARTWLDATYLTPAVRLETQVMTGDVRFARKLAEHPLLAQHVRSVTDFVSE